MIDPDFDSSEMDDDEYQEQLRQYAEEQHDAIADEMKETYGEDVVFTTSTEDKSKDRYTIEFHIKSDSLDLYDVEQWAHLVLKQLPEGSTTDVTAHPVLVNVEDLTEDHVGSTVKVTINGNVVEGELEAVHVAGEGTADARVLIINGRAWRTTYGVVQVNLF